MNWVRLVFGALLVGIAWLGMGRLHAPDQPNQLGHWSCWAPALGMLLGVGLARARSMVFAVIAALILSGALMAWLAPQLVDPADRVFLFALWAVHWFFGLAALAIGILAVAFPAQPQANNDG